MRPGLAALRWTIVVAVLLAPLGPAAFVSTGSILGPGTSVFDGWEGTDSVVDGNDLGQQTQWNFRRVWIALGTPAGGNESASSTNPIEYLYLRIDHNGSTAAPNANWNIQWNLGKASVGFVDHLLSMRSDGPDVVLVRLSEYDQPYPRLGAFTTNTLTERASNIADSPKFQPGVMVRTGLWSASKHGFEVAIPISWFPDVPVSGRDGDGGGPMWLIGAAFSSGGSFGAVATTRDVVQDKSGAVVTIVGDPVTGQVTFEPATATNLRFAAPPSPTPEGEPLAPLVVDVIDMGGAVVDTASHYVTLAIGEDPSGAATLGGTVTVRAQNGTATFDEIWIDRAGTNYTLVASAGNVEPATSAPFEVIEAVRQVSVASEPVAPDGTPDPARWGGWDALPAGADVRASNYLKVDNTGNIGRISFRVAFAPEGLVGAADPSWSVAASSLQFRCGYTGTNEAPQELFTDAVPWGSDAPGSHACTFPPGSAPGGTMYVQYRIVSLPAILPAQAYRASFTVDVED